MPAMNAHPQILVVDDEPSVREMIAIFLRREQYEVTLASSGEKAVNLWESGERYDLVISDLAMHRGSGIDVLTAVKAHDPHCPVILITAFGTTESAVEAMKKGAHDYIAKPFNVEEFKHIVRQALHHRRLVHENIALRRRIGEGSPSDDLVFRSESMRRVVSLAQKVAMGTASVLLAGESGTGKEVMARFIHNTSDRRDAPFVAINCGAMPENLMESELFGHRKGAFTGATFDKPGLFQAADKGTLFLDEIGDLPPQLQVKLLRVLQERTVRPVGAAKEIPVDVRIVSASNRVLEEEVQAGRFRADLFYRLNVIAIAMPPLRERPEDIPPLVSRLLGPIARENQSPVKTVSPEALKYLIDYPFMGNVRELKNILERAVALASGPHIMPADLPSSVTGLARPTPTYELPALQAGFDLDAAMQAFERYYIDTALARTDGVQAAAADLLGIPVRSLRYRIKRESLSPDEPEGSGSIGE